ncbi:MAG: ABC transporter permease [Bacteroidales bacterium]|nr:ABC transporter permease [Bacteroidales bacterium]
MLRKQWVKLLTEIYLIAAFMMQTFRYMFRRPFEFSEFNRQLYVIGYRSSGLIGVTAFIMGLVLTLQTRPVMSSLGAESWVPTTVFIATVIEIGPVITALLFAGRVGSRIGAELSSMRVTEQIDAMEVSGVYPMRFLVVTRVLATTFMLPVLVFYADFVALIGSYVGYSMHNNIGFGLFIKEAFDEVYFKDIIPATIKTFFFGYFIGLLSCYTGYNTNRGAEGVGLATNTAVILSSVSIFIIDLVTVQITEIVMR